MTIDNSKGYTVITAEQNMFLSNEDMTLHSEIGGSIVLGSTDSPSNYRELPEDQYPVITDSDENPFPKLQHKE